jgi:hypothetical protein
MARHQPMKKQLMKWRSILIVANQWRSGGNGVMAAAA